MLATTRAPQSADLVPVSISFACGCTRTVRVPSAEAEWAPEWRGRRSCPVCFRTGRQPQVRAVPAAAPVPASRVEAHDELAAVTFARVAGELGRLASASVAHARVLPELLAHLAGHPAPWWREYAAELTAETLAGALDQWAACLARPSLVAAH